MSGPIVGIDLGTTNSVVAHMTDEGKAIVFADDRDLRIQPSVVSFHPNASVLVGASAKQRRIIDPRNTIYSVKRLIGRSFRSREVKEMSERAPFEIREGVNQKPVVLTRSGELSIPEISAIVLDHMRTIAKSALAVDITRAVVTVPASFTEAQRAATATAGAIAGIDVVRVLNEPTAAALAYGHKRPANDQSVAVYDFGGGTFDVTILRLHDHVYEVLASAGDSFLGGDDIDERLVGYMAERFLREARVDLKEDELAMQRVRAVAEQTKIDLSRQQQSVMRIDEIAYGEAGNPLHLELTITRDELCALAEEIVRRTFPVCDEALHLAGLRARDLDEVVLVGGATKMPLVRERVAQYFDRGPRTDVHPDEAVAVGAAIQGDALARVMQDPPVRATAKQAVPPPAPPMQALPPLPASARPAPPPAEEIARKLAPPPRHTAQRVAPTAVREAQPDEREEIIGEEPFGGDTQEVTNVHPFATPRRTMPGGAAAPMPVASDADPTPVRQTDPQPFHAAQPPQPLAAEPLPTEPPAPPEPAGSAALEDVLGLVGDNGETADLWTPAPADPGAEHQTPVVLDVVPQSLGIGTVAGFCEPIVERNSGVPCEYVRVFTTSTDYQATVRIRICQGDSRRISENTYLGEVVLKDLEPHPRGSVSVEVTFRVDASGILHVFARDKETGIEKGASVNLLGRQTAEELEVAKQRFRQIRS